MPFNKTIAAYFVVLAFWQLWVELRFLRLEKAAQEAKEDARQD